MQGKQECVVIDLFMYFLRENIWSTSFMKLEFHIPLGVPRKGPLNISAVVLTFNR